MRPLVVCCCVLQIRVAVGEWVCGLSASVGRVRTQETGGQCTEQVRLTTPYHIPFTPVCLSPQVHTGLTTTLQVSVCQPVHRTGASHYHVPFTPVCLSPQVHTGLTTTLQVSVCQPMHRTGASHYRIPFTPVCLSLQVHSGKHVSANAQNRSVWLTSHYRICTYLLLGLNINHCVARVCRNSARDRVLKPRFSWVVLYYILAWFSYVIGDC